MTVKTPRKERSQSHLQYALVNVDITKNRDALLHVLVFRLDRSHHIKEAAVGTNVHVLDRTRKEPLFTRRVLIIQSQRYTTNVPGDGCVVRSRCPYFGFTCTVKPHEPIDLSIGKQILRCSWDVRS